jgi:hypothetical protein
MLSLINSSILGSNIGIHNEAQRESQYGDDTEVDEVVID